MLVSCDTVSGGAWRLRPRAPRTVTPGAGIVMHACTSPLRLPPCLPADTDERVIRKWFEAYGPVAAVKVRLYSSRRPATSPLLSGAWSCAISGPTHLLPVCLLDAASSPPSLVPFLPLPLLQLIYDKETGRSKGFGFVTFDDDRDARDALNDAGGRDLDGAAIKVNIAHGPAFFQPFSAGGRGRGRCALLLAVANIGASTGVLESGWHRGFGSKAAVVGWRLAWLLGRLPACTALLIA